MQRIGFIGLGVMGKPMALNLQKAGFELYVFDLVEAAIEELKAAGAKACANVGELAEIVDIAFTSLPNGKIVESVIGAFLANARQGQIVVDLSTVAPHTTLAMAKAAKEKGVSYIDAPVSGGSAGASKGTLTIMAGGDKNAVDKAMPYLLTIGKTIHHLGGEGTGNAMKLVNNMLLGCNMAAVAEALALGVKSGLAPEKMFDVIKASSGSSYALEAKVPSFIFKRAFSNGFAVDLQYKDLDLAIETAKSQRLPVPLTALAQQVYETARAKDLGREDISAVVKLWEDTLGFEIKPAE